MTEFTSSHGVRRSSAPNQARPRTFHYLAFEPDEHPISAQLFGADPEVMADAARVCEDLGFDIVDINFGCPVKKVVRCNGGSGLLRDLPLVERCCAGARGHLDPAHDEVPRRLERQRDWWHVQMARLAEDCGCAGHRAAPAHARAGLRRPGRLEPHRRGEGRGEDSGDRQRRHRTPEDAVRMVEETGCDAVMIGRAAARPIPGSSARSQQYLATGAYDIPTARDRYDMMRRYYADADRAADPDTAGKMKQFATYFTHGVRNGARLRADIYQARDARGDPGLVDAFFEA